MPITVAGPFTGDLEGNFLALDARTGKILFQTMIGEPLGGGIISYEVAGKQLIAVANLANANEMFLFILDFSDIKLEPSKGAFWKYPFRKIKSRFPGYPVNTHSRLCRAVINGRPLYPWTYCSCRTSNNLT